mmetsp:Transcript_22546/g.34073  ORF Transcript_22546/g.34073 Transcript_22546/m.34073 type:complete len:98 (+) Transcript_22546:1509-1802(+)
MSGVSSIIIIYGARYSNEGRKIHSRTKPLQLPDSTSGKTLVLVCTTGGHIVMINDDNQHNINWKHKVAAEIWSNPMLLKNGKNIWFALKQEIRVFIF